MAILVIAEHYQQQISPATYSTITAAQKLGNDIHLIVFGQGVEAAAKHAATIHGVQKVLLVNDNAYAHFLPENIAPIVVSIATSYSHLLIPSNTFGKNLMPRIAALLDIAQITDVIEVISADTFKRPIYAGNAIATVQSHDSIKALTIRPTAFVKAGEGNQASIEIIKGQGDSQLSRYVKSETSDNQGPDLTTARVVISGGRGLGDAAHFKLLESLAKKIGNCAIGASRAAVDAGYISNEYQVGQTGKIVAPELYIAVGISGAIQHLAGMKDSKIIVAINKDENAPIFEIATYGLVADLFDILPKFEKLL